MTADAVAAVEHDWLAEPSLALVALGLGLASSVVGWLWKPPGGAAVVGRVRWAGLASRIGMLACLAAAVSGVSRPAHRSTPTPSPGVLAISLSLPPVAWPGDTVAIEASLTSLGIDPEALSVEATIEGPEPAAEETLPLLITAAPVPMRSAPDRPGPRPPTAAITRHVGRSVLDRPGRHRVFARSITSNGGRPGGTVECRGVIDVMERPVSVLVIDSRPRFETRFLDRSLLRDGRIDHALHLQPSGTDGGTEARLPATPLPTSREDWNRHDCVVLGGIDPTRSSAEAWTSLVEAVARDGLGVIWTLDGRCDLEAIRASSLRRLAPVTGLPRPPDQPALEPFRLALPAVGSIQAPWWLALAPGEDAPGEGLQAFGPVYDVFQPGRLRPTARIAARFTGADQSPAIIEDRLGRGRILTFLSETWRWRGTLAGTTVAAANAERVDRLWRGAILTVAAPHLSPPDESGATPVDSHRGERTTEGDATVSVERRTGQGVAPEAAMVRSERPVWPPTVALAMLLVIASTEWWLRARGGMP